MLFDLPVLRFYIKSALYLLVPGGYGYCRTLHQQRDPGYNHERDKHPLRYKHHSTAGWRQDREIITYRDYADYDEYVDHQRLKFDEMLKAKSGFDNRTVFAYRMKFYRRFRHLPRYLPLNARILCAGARQGTEVEVLHDLGFKSAYGIDLNTGPDNPFVRQGDFMHLEEEASSLDLIYSNSVDHAFDLEAFFAEHARVIKPSGHVLYDLPLEQGGGPSPFEAVRWKSEEDVFLMMLAHFCKVVRVEEDQGWKWFLLQGKR